MFGTVSRRRTARQRIHGGGSIGQDFSQPSSTCNSGRPKFRTLPHFTERHVVRSPRKRMPNGWILMPLLISCSVVGLVKLSLKFRRRMVRSTSSGWWTDPIADSQNEPVPDYGGLAFKSLKLIPDKHYGRVIDPEAEVQYHTWRERWLTEMDQNDSVSSQDHALPDEACKQTAVHSYLFPNCNAFHELSGGISDKRNLGHSFYRMAWLVEPTNFLGDSFVLKTQLWRHEFDSPAMEMVQKEATVMEQLSGSPRISNIYGLCATSVFVERLYRNLASTVIRPVMPFFRTQLDPLSIEDKLNLTITLAESIADLHGYSGGVIVNTDISLTQYLYTRDGTLKLNDFNLASILDWNPEGQTYCKDKREIWPEQRYTPEQRQGAPFDEKVDVYALGNMIESVLTGWWRGLDLAFRPENYMEERLLSLTKRLWVGNATDRPDIFEIVTYLRETRARAPRR